MTPIKLIRLTKMPDPVIRRMGLLDRLVMPSKASASILLRDPHRGADYKLVAGRNFIGRAAAMDVSLADDDTVSRESHALVTYDAKHNSFSLSPGQGRGITYCNEEQVEMVRPLNAYDVIEVGKSQLIFLPLCGEKFQWNEE